MEEDGHGALPKRDVATAKSEERLGEPIPLTDGFPHKEIETMSTEAVLRTVNFNAVRLEGVIL